MKKIISILLILAMMLAMSATALAAAPQDLVYDRDATLKASFKKFGNVTVKSGVTLTIDKSSGFEIAGNITVEPGGRIICNGVSKGDFTFAMCEKNSTITGMDIYFNYRTGNGTEVRLSSNGYEPIRAQWVNDVGVMAPSFKWNESVQGWCLTGSTNINYSNEPSYHSDRDMDTARGFADRLKTLGLFRGTDNGYELDRSGSRVEALAMLVRMLGKESEALAGEWKHPFKDVPEWADKYVGYAYEAGLTKGVGADRFGSGDTATAQMYYTFVLRALGNGDDGDFKVYDHAFEMAGAADLRDGKDDSYIMSERIFWRADMVVTSYRALRAKTVGGGTLGEKLAADGVFSADALRDATR